MKKLFAVFCITLGLLFSGAAVAVRADGNGHDGGRHCTETVNCPANNPLPQTSPPSPASDSTGEETAWEDMLSALLNWLLPLL